MPDVRHRIQGPLHLVIDHDEHNIRLLGRSFGVDLSRTSGEGQRECRQGNGHELHFDHLNDSSNWFEPSSTVRLWPPAR